jgi:hypothetical protein
MAEIAGPVRTTRNFLTGGLHGPDADRYGFPAGGAVGANMHMDRFPPVLLAHFGEAWFVRGSVSLYYEQAVGAGVEVQVVLAPEGDERCAVRYRRADDDATIATGDAGLSLGEATALRRRDLRPTDPAELKAFGGLEAGQVMADEVRTMPAAVQLDQLKRGEIDDAPACWSDASAFGGIVACPSVVVQLLNRNEGGSPAATWARSNVPDGATMFGAIELAYEEGPVLLDTRYRVVSRAAAVGQSPRTEYCWWDSTIERPDGTLVARTRALTRIFKAGAGTG